MIRVESVTPFTLLSCGEKKKRKRYKSIQCSGRMQVILHLHECTLHQFFSTLKKKKKDLYLSDDSFVLPDPAVFLLQPYIVKE